MKFGCNYSYWQNMWDFTIDEYIDMTNKLADCGFDVLEISADHLYHMSDGDIKRLKLEGEKRKLEFSTNSGPDRKYDLASSDRTIRENGIHYFRTIMEKMQKLGSKILVGAIYSFWPTDFIGDDEKQAAWDRSIESLKHVGGDAEKNNVVIALEVLNRNETYLLNDHHEALEFCRQISCPAVKILLDTYHMNIEEDNMCDAIRETGSMLAHVHVGECNRKLPGMNNSLDWPAIGRALRDIHYDHYVVMEPFLLKDGEIGHGCRVYRDLSGGANDEEMTKMLKKSLVFLRSCCLGIV